MSQAADAIAFCQAQLGKPYQWDAAGPDAYDCSGLLVAAFAQANPPVHLVHYTGAMLGEGIPITQSQLQPGDAIFPDSGHVVLYIGGNQVIEAPHEGANVQQVPMYGFWQGRRFATDGQTASDAGGTGIQLAADKTPLDPLNPTSTVGEIKDTFSSFIKIGSDLISPTFWTRIGAGIIAAMLIIVGLLILFRKPIGTVVGGAVGTATGLGKEAALTKVRFRTETSEVNRLHKLSSAASSAGSGGGGGGGYSPGGHGPSVQPLPSGPSPLHHGPGPASAGGAAKYSPQHQAFTMSSKSGRNVFSVAKKSAPGRHRMMP